MDFSEALRRTMFEFEITGTQLSQVSGVSQRQISEFKNGERHMRSDNLKKILDAMPPEARRYLLELVVCDRASA
jgi:predicted transcriptional regulator